MSAVDNQEKSLSARTEGTATSLFFFSATIGFVRGVLEIQLDNWCFVIRLREVSPRVSFLGYLKFFK